MGSPAAVVTVPLHHPESQGTAAVMQTSLLMISVVLLVVSLKAAAGLKCEVGVNNETQILECEGSWEKVKMMLQEKMGSKWEMVQQNMTSGITNLIESMKGQSVAEPLSMACGALPGTGPVCVCNAQDVCNSA